MMNLPKVEKGNSDCLFINSFCVDSSLCYRFILRIIMGMCRARCRNTLMHWPRCLWRCQESHWETRILCNALESAFSFQKHVLRKIGSS